jgi:hypothetical protein
MHVLGGFLYGINFTDHCRPGGNLSTVNQPFVKKNMDIDHTLKTSAARANPA